MPFSVWGHVALACTHSLNGKRFLWGVTHNQDISMTMIKCSLSSKEKKKSQFHPVSTSLPDNKLPFVTFLAGQHCPSVSVILSNTEEPQEPRLGPL